MELKSLLKTSAVQASEALHAQELLEAQEQHHPDVMAGGPLRASGR